MYSKVKAEVMKAYADRNMGWDEGSQLRNLSYFSEIAVTPTEAIEILTLALAPEDNDYDPNYNDFVPTILENLPEDAKVVILVDWLVRKRVRQNVGGRLRANDSRIDVALERGRVTGMSSLPLGNRRIDGRTVGEIRSAHPVKQPKALVLRTIQTDVLDDSPGVHENRFRIFRIRENQFPRPRLDFVEQAATRGRQRIPLRPFVFLIANENPVATDIAVRSRFHHGGDSAGRPIQNVEQCQPPSRRWDTARVARQSLAVG